MSRMALAWWVLALVLAPTVGRLHQVVHADALNHVPARHATQGVTASGTHLWQSGRGDGLLEQLFPRHAPEDCLLLDQLALGDALQGAQPALPGVMPAQALPRGGTGRHAVPHAALFQARGPPAA